MNTNVPEFTGKANGPNASEWLRPFKRYIVAIGANIEGKLEVFGTFMTGPAQIWYEALPNDVRTNWETLEARFRQRFNHESTQQPVNEISQYSQFLELSYVPQDAEMLSDKKRWHDHLSRLLDLSVEVGAKVSLDVLAHHVRAALPSRIQAMIPIRNTVSAIVADAKGIRDAEIDATIREIRGQQEVEQHRNYLSAINTRLGELERRQLGRGFRSTPAINQYYGPSEQNRDYQQELQPAASAPMQHSQSAPARPVTPTAGAYNSFGGNGSNQQMGRQPAIEIEQNLTFPDTLEGHRAYDSAIKKYYQQYLQARLAPSVAVPFPLTPGTLLAGSNECHRCGHGGHIFEACTATRPVPQAELSFRRSMGAAITRRRRERRGPSPAMPASYMGYWDPENE